MPLRYEQNPKGKWHTNTKCPRRLKPTDLYKTTVEEQIQYIEGFIIGPPKPGAFLTVEKLASMGMVGLYSDTEMAKPEEHKVPFDDPHPLDNINFSYSYESIAKMADEWMKESEKMSYKPIYLDSLSSYFNPYGGPGTGKTENLKKSFTPVKIKMPKVSIHG